MNIENEIFKIYDEINEIQSKIGSLEERNPDTLEKYSRMIFDLKRKMQRLEKDLYLHREPDLVSDEIDLYVKNFHSLKEESPDYLNYIIVEHGTKNKIGELRQASVQVVLQAARTLRYSTRRSLLQIPKILTSISCAVFLLRS